MLVLVLSLLALQPSPASSVAPTGRAQPDGGGATLAQNRPVVVLRTRFNQSDPFRAQGGVLPIRDAARLRAVVRAVPGLNASSLHIVGREVELRGIAPVTQGVTPVAAGACTVGAACRLARVAQSRESAWRYQARVMVDGHPRRSNVVEIIWHGNTFTGTWTSAYGTLTWTSVNGVPEGHYDWGGGGTYKVTRTNPDGSLEGMWIPVDPTALGPGGPFKVELKGATFDFTDMATSPPKTWSATCTSGPCLDNG